MNTEILFNNYVAFYALRILEIKIKNLHLTLEKYCNILTYYYILT